MGTIFRDTITGWTSISNAELERMKAEIERLRGALKKYADRNNWSPLDEHGYNPSEWLPEQEGWKQAEEALQGSLADEG